MLLVGCVVACVVSVAGCMLLDPFAPVERAVVDDGEHEGGTDLRSQPEGSISRPCDVEKCATPEDESCDGQGTCTGETRWAIQLGDTPGEARHQHATRVVVDALGRSYVIGYFEGTVPLAGIPPLASGGVDGRPDAFIVKLGPDGTLIWSVALRDVTLTSIALAAGGIVVGGSAGDDLVVPGCTPASKAVEGTRALVVRFDEGGLCKAIAAVGDGRGDQTVLEVAVDSQTDDVLAAGMFTGTLDFRGTSAPLIEGKREGFYVRLGPGLFGKHTFRLSSLDRVDIRGVVLSRRGTAIVYGWFNGKLLGRTPRGTFDGFTASFDEAGNLREVDSYGGIGATFFDAAAVDASDRLVIVGTMKDVDFAPYGPRLVSAGQQNMFVMRRALAGTPVIEASSFGGEGFDFPKSVAVDAASNVLVVGELRGERTSIGGGVVTPRGDDAFVAKYDERDLSHRWSRVLGDPLSQSANGVAADALGDVLVVGGFEGKIDFGAGITPLAAGGGQTGPADAFVAKLMP